jgi:hypothetical protein
VRQIASGVGPTADPEEFAASQPCRLSVKSSWLTRIVGTLKALQ